MILYLTFLKTCDKFFDKFGCIDWKMWVFEVKKKVSIDPMGEFQMPLTAIYKIVLHYKLWI